MITKIPHFWEYDQKLETLSPDDAFRFVPRVRTERWRACGKGRKSGTHKGIYSIPAGDNLSMRVKTGTDFQEQPEVAYVPILLCHCK